VVHDGQADPNDRVGLYEVGAGDDAPVSWFYLNGTQTPPAMGLSTADLTFQAPRLGGFYEFRFFSRGQRIATSSSLLVTGVEIFLDFAGGDLPDLPGVVEVNGSTGRNHPSFAAFGGEPIDVQIGKILDDVRQDFAPFAVRVIRDDHWQTNPLFGSGDTVIMVGGDGAWVAGTNPVVTATSVRWVAGIAPWDLGNTVANVGFVFSGATASAFSVLGWSVSLYAQQIANTVSHEIGHTFGLDHVTSLNGTNELMGTAATGTQIRGDGAFTDVILPREHGGAYSSFAYLSNLFGAPATGGSAGGNGDNGGGPDPLTFEISRSPSVPTGPSSYFLPPSDSGRSVVDRLISAIGIPPEIQKRPPTRSTNSRNSSMPGSVARRIPQQPVFQAQAPEQKKAIETLWDDDDQPLEETDRWLDDLALTICQIRGHRDRPNWYQE
jgi:hypothetical protein